MHCISMPRALIPSLCLPINSKAALVPLPSVVGLETGFSKHVSAATLQRISGQFCVHERSPETEHMFIQSE